MNPLQEDLSQYGEIELEGAVREYQLQRQELADECNRIHVEMSRRAELDMQALVLAEMDPAVRDGLGIEITPDLEQRMRKYAAHRTHPDPPEMRGLENIVADAGTLHSMPEPTSEQVVANPDDFEAVKHHNPGGGPRRISLRRKRDG